MRRERAFTLIELLIVTVALGGIILVGTGLVLSIRSTERFSAEYTGDLSGLRRAVRIVENDLRAATDITDLDIRLDGDRLVRGDRVLARNVALFEVTRDGPLARIRIGLGSRCSAPRKRGELTFSVRMRNVGGPR